MDRRRFLKFLGQGAAAATAATLTHALDLDPERTLWVPGKKTFFLPTPEKVEVVAAGKLDLLDEIVKQTQWPTDAQLAPRLRRLLCDDIVDTYWSREINGYVTARNIVQNGVIVGRMVKPLHTVGERKARAGRGPQWSDSTTLLDAHGNRIR